MPTGRSTRSFVLCCLAVIALFGLVCVFDDECCLCVSPCRSDGLLRPPDDAPGGVVVRDVRRLLSAPSARHRPSAPGLLAAVPGGLCLLL
jgi:hypothetical protein